MNAPILLPNPKVAISPVGLRITSELSFEEWSELATAIGQAARSIAFIVGDWLVYGQSLFGTDGFPDKRVDSASVAEEEAGRRMTTRRLRKSLNLGRIATSEDLEPQEADKGIENHLPYVNRISVWWKRMQRDRFLATATDEQREALKRDLEPVVAIYQQL